MDENLFGDPFEEGLKKKATIDEKKKRKWEDAFQRWSNQHGIDGYDHYGCCGFGQICDYCKDNHYGRPCVRALNEMLRTKHKKINYETITFKQAFDGEIKNG